MDRNSVSLVDGLLAQYQISTTGQGREGQCRARQPLTVQSPVVLVCKGMVLRGHQLVPQLLRTRRRGGRGGCGGERKMNVRERDVVFCMTMPR